MATSLSVYPNNQVSTTLSTANKLLENPTTNASNYGNLNTNLNSNTTGWVLLWSQGQTTAQSGAGSEPDPDDHGWIDDRTTLEGKHIVAGNWTWQVELETTASGTFTCDIHCRAYQRTSAGVYNLIAEGVLTSQTITNSSYTTFTVTATAAGASNIFGAGDKLYWDTPINIITNSTSANVRVRMSNSTTIGYPTVNCTTPGYVALTTSTRTMPSSLALLWTKNRTVASQVAINNVGSRQILASIALGQLRSFPLSVALSQTSARQITTSLSLTNTGSRSVPIGISLYQPAVFYTSNVPATIGGLTQSDQMAQAPGGVETSVAVTMPGSGTGTYVELLSQGGSSPATNALPNPSGKGWSLDLSGSTILSGSWSAVFTLAKSGTAMSGGSLFVRWFRRTVDGVCYPIASVSLTGQTFSTKATYLLPSQFSNIVYPMIAGDTLYMDAFVYNSTTAWAGETLSVYVSNSALSGVNNDGLTIAPGLINTPDGLFCLIGSDSFQTGSSLFVLDQSFTINNAIDQRSILTLTVKDDAGTLVFTRGMPIIFAAHDKGVLYSGYINSDKMTRTSADSGVPEVQHQITMMDHHYGADKDPNLTNYLNWKAGDIVCDMAQKILAAEGIWGEYALDSDYSPATLSAGTLSNTVATTTTTPFVYAPNTATPPITSNTGDLELMRAGTAFSLTEAVTGDFGTGTLTNMVALNDSLIPTTQNALKMHTFLPYTYGIELAPSETTVSGGTANVSGYASLGGSATVTGTANLSSFYTPSGSVNISGGTPGESAYFSGYGASINPSGSVTSNGSANTSGTVNSSGPVSGMTVSQGYQPKYKSVVTVDGKHYTVTTADAAVVDNRIDAIIWTGSMTIGSGDKLNYDIWISSTSPMYQAGVELYFSDGSSLTQYVGQPDTNFSVGQWDQNTLSVLPIEDLSDFAKDTWYIRQVDLAALSGKTITKVSLFNSANQAGTYDVYYKNIYLNSHSGSPFFSTSATAPAVNPPTGFAIGAYIVPATVIEVVPIYNPATSYRITPVHSIDAVKLAQNSTITWVASTPTFGPTVTKDTPGAATSAGSAAIFISYDGTTWLPCTNNAALPGLPAGANVAGASFYLMESFSGGQDPTAIPALLQLQITINSAAKTTKSDVTATYGTTTAWNSGTHQGTAPNSNGDLALGLSTYSWANLTNMTYAAGNASRSNPTQSTSSGAYVISSGGSSSGTSWSASRFNFLAATQNFTAEADFTLSDSSSPAQNEIGFTYRQTYWGSPNNSFAYYVRVMRAPGGQAGGTSVSLGVGINNPPSSSDVGGGPVSGTYTNLVQIGLTINSGTTYHLKLVVNQNRHQIYWNHGSSPIIDILDSTYTAAGNLGLRTYVDGGSSCVGKIANLSVSNTFSGVWLSPSIPLTSLVTIGNAQIAWSEVNNQNDPQTTAVVLSSLDGGATWAQCTNGATTPTATIPGLTQGTNVTGVSLIIQVIIYSTGLLNSPIINGLFVRVCGSFGTVTGTRISPPLALSSVGYMAYSNVMYNANSPIHTSIAVATSVDRGATWATVANNGAGDTLPYWTPQVAAIQDLFATNTAGLYSNTHKTGGSNASAAYYIPTGSLTLVGGTSALYLRNSLSYTDIDMLCDLDVSDTGGVVFREVDTGNYYEAVCYDASSSASYPNQVRLYKVVAGTRNLLGNAAITFTRGTFHRLRASMQGNLINVYFDGSCLIPYLDTSSPFTSGGCGLRNDGGTSRYYQFYAQALGTNLSGQALQTKITLSTSDPAYMPQLFTVTACVRGASIGTGATIQQLHPISTPFAAYVASEFDNLISASGDWYWFIDEWRQLRFAARMARQGAFPLHSVNDPAQASGMLLYTPQMTLLSSADLYRNKQIVTNVTGLITPPVEVKVADGNTTSWTLGYPVYSAPSISVDGGPATVGIQAIDNQKQFYWQPGSSSISYDSTLPVLPAGAVIRIEYVGQSPVLVNLDNGTNQGIQQMVELNSGVVTQIVDASTSLTNGMTEDQATTFANGLLARYGNNNTIELTGATLYSGLQPGTVVPLFLPEIMSTWKVQLPIVKITTIGYLTPTGVLYQYTIDATNGPNLSQWQRVWF